MTYQKTLKTIYRPLKEYCCRERITLFAKPNVGYSYIGRYKSPGHQHPLGYKPLYLLTKILFWIQYYNIARALVLSNSHCVIMNQISMDARPCSIKWRVQFISAAKFPSRLVQVPLFNQVLAMWRYSEQSYNPTSSLWLLPGKDVYFEVSILALLVYIFSEYLYFVWLRFHSDNLNSKKRIFHW